MPLQIRRGTDVQRQAMTPAAGELIFVTNTNQLYVGNGSTPGGILATGYTNNDAQDAAAVIFTANNPAHSNISFAYNTSTNLITAVVDLADYQGVIKAGAFKGSVFADDGSTVGGTELVNAVDGSINLNSTVKDHIIPDANVAYDLGSASFRFRDLYLSGSSIELGAATITATGSAVNLPAGSTVAGVALGIGSGGGIDDYRGNIIGDDSTIIVNTATNSIVATGGIFGVVIGNLFGDTIGYHTGDVTGSVFSDGSTLLVDGVSGQINGSVLTEVTTPRVSVVRNTAAGFSLSINAVTVAVNDTSSGIEFSTSGGSIAAPTDLDINEQIFIIVGKAWKQDQGDYMISTAIEAVVDSAYIGGQDVVPTKLVFYTSDGTRDYDAGNLEMSLDGVGKLSAANIEARNTFNLPVFANSGARDAAISTPIAGMMIFITGTGMQVRGATSWNTVAGTAT